MGIKSALILFGTALALLAAPAANASVVYLAAGSDSDGTLVGSAQITLGTNSITVTITDTGTGQISSGQTIAGIEFTVSGVTSVSLTTQAGSLLDFDKSTGQPSPVAGSPTHWGAAITSGTTVGLQTAGLGGGKPDDLIVGTSPNANKGFSSHNPYIAGTGTFTLSAAGVTSSSTIGNVELLFGTQPFAVTADPFINGVPVGSTVPEPSTWVMMILGFVGLGFLACRKSGALRFA